MFFPCIFFDGTCFFHDVYVIRIPSTTYILFPLLPHTSLHCRKSYTSKCTSGRVCIVGQDFPCFFHAMYCISHCLKLADYSPSSLKCCVFHFALLCTFIPILLQHHPHYFLAFSSMTRTSFALTRFF